MYDVRSVQWVDLHHKTKSFLSWPQLPEEEIQRQPRKQAEDIHINKDYTSYAEDAMVSQVTQQ